uniref:Ubiquitin carboxyl-terminal hydrolase 47 C-terminal domain-containing protein n=1 Tax=Amphimedon queenslandica TaxID=400682 RepID=A0A1X7UUG8_AMPQE
MPDPAAAYDQLQYLVDVLGFQFQLREGINLRISVIHLASGVVSSPKPMRAELGLTVEELKRHIGEEGYTDIAYNLNSSCMRLVMREKDYWSDISVSDISGVGEIQVLVDKRITLAQLKEELVPLIGVPPTGFSVYKTNGYGLKRLDEILMNLSESKLIVRLGRELQEGEHRIKLYLLQVNSIEFCKYMMESIVAKSTPMRNFKKQIIEEAKVQGIDCVLELDKMRLRSKNGVSPDIVYYSDDWTVAGSDSEMYVEPLTGPEKKLLQTQAYVIRWRPSQCSVDPIEDIILDDRYDTKFIIEKVL